MTIPFLMPALTASHDARLPLELEHAASSEPAAKALAGELHELAALSLLALCAEMLRNPLSMGMLCIVTGCCFACGLIVAGWQPAVAAPEQVTLLCVLTCLALGLVVTQVLRAALRP